VNGFRAEAVRLRALLIGRGVAVLQVVDHHRELLEAVLRLRGIVEVMNGHLPRAGVVLGENLAHVREFYFRKFLCWHGHSIASCDHIRFGLLFRYARRRYKLVRPICARFGNRHRLPQI